MERERSMRIDSYDEVKALTRALVKIPSINKMPGEESAAARYIYDYYCSLPYFKEHGEQVKIFQTKDDFVERHCTYAYVKGTGGSRRTVILIGHLDTVGTDDFGPVKDYAHDPDRLPEKLLELGVPEEVAEDIRSGKYMFGRGALDMKSGVAGHMVLVKYFSEHPEELNGNLLALAECDEEDNSKGMITALDEFADVKDREGFDYVACINADYSTHHGPGDENRYIYYGSIGKLLPTFYVFGKEAHVGQAFSAFDPNLLIAEITRRMTLNTDLCDVACGEVTVPPISLKQTDTKPCYTVQTNLSAYAYFNYFTHGLSPAAVLDKSRRVAEEAFEETVRFLNDRYAAYCKLIGAEFEPLPWKPRVLTYGEFYGELAERHGGAFTSAVHEFAAKLHREQPEMDLREFSNRVIEEAFRWSEDRSPVVILYFGSIYSARIEMTGETPKEAALLSAVEKAVAEVSRYTDRKIKTRMFYPYISDSSFMAVCDDLKELKALEENMPSWGTKYHYDIDKILRINVPVVNIGSFGKDGHMLTERVDMRHTFENVPNITYLTIRELLK